MSGYWQAIERDLRGVPADAQPRERSRFETPFSERAGADPVIESEEQIDATLAPQQRTAPRSETVPPADLPLPTQRTADAGGRVNEAMPPQRAPSARPVAAPSAPSVADAGPDLADAAPGKVKAGTPALPVGEAPPEPVTRPLAEPDPSPLPVATAPLRVEQVPIAPEREADRPPAYPVEASPILPAPVVAEPVTMPFAFDDPIAAHEDAADASSPPLMIEIGEIQIRIAPDPAGARAAAPLRAAGGAPVASLDDFLARRGKDGR